MECKLFGCCQLRQNWRLRVTRAVALVSGSEPPYVIGLSVCDKGPEGGRPFLA
jgi:hypothetical protein